MRNLWFLMLYASEIARFAGRFSALVEEDLDDLPDLVGRLLSGEVERRLRRNLSRGYRYREAVLTRVRGRIDVLVTSTRRLLDGGEVACQFDEQTFDTPRNRLVRTALDRVARFVRSPEIGRRCRSLARELGRAGVSGLAPSRAELAREQIGRNDAEDRFMLALARLALDLALPTEEAGHTPLTSPCRDEHWVRRLFEKAIAGFYSVELGPKGWEIGAGEMLRWPVTTASAGIESVLPTMRTDMILDAPDDRRLVIDTKFTSILGVGWYRDESLKSGYLYQMYAYLRTQETIENPGSPSNRAEGILLHPAVDKPFRENLTVQGHPISFVTVDLTQSPNAIRRTLLEIVGLRQEATPSLPIL